MFMSAYPAQGAYSVTPADSLLPKICRGLYIGTSGNVGIRGLDGLDVVFVGVHGGTVLNVGCVVVFATGTTATNIIALL